MTKHIIQTSLIFGITLLFLGTGAIGSLNSNISNNSSIRGNTLYVGGAEPGNYTKIQAAIDNASDGDTIIVYAKTYYENQIIINKAISIQGAGLTTTIIDGSDAILTSDGLVRIIANGDVTFQGFTIRNAGGRSGYGGGDNKENIGIVVCSSTPDVTYTISSNKIIGTQNPDDDYDWGFYAVSGGQENIIFTNNIVTETGCNNIVIEKTTGSTDIGFNLLDAGCYGIDSIYYMTYGGVDITTLQKINNNTIDLGTGYPSSKVTAIGFSSAYSGCTGVPDSGKYTNIIICGNIINNVKELKRGIAIDNFAWGNGADGEIFNTLIESNIINSVSTASTSFGIRLSGLVTNTSILKNQITNCNMSFWGRTGYYGDSTAFPVATRINYNNFSDNSKGLVWEGAALLNAEYNWWGDASGPQHPSNPNGLGDPISGNVDYSPWLFYYGPEVTIPIVKIISPEQRFLYINFFGIFPLKIKFFTTVVIGKIEVSVNATDSQSGIKKVEFYVDDQLKETDTTAPYNWIWSDRVIFFPYTIKVIAYDNAVNQNSDELKVWKMF
jgi:Bacterial Ig domain